MHVCSGVLWCVVLYCIMTCKGSLLGGVAKCINACLLACVVTMNKYKWALKVNLQLAVTVYPMVPKNSVKGHLQERVNCSLLSRGEEKGDLLT